MQLIGGMQNPHIARIRENDSQRLSQAGFATLFHQADHPAGLRSGSEPVDSNTKVISINT
ncbi:MAG: hypothetical protein MH208_15495 [Marinobacter sp.]|nr:hypothetical protein [Marinobacter sp.]